MSAPYRRVDQPDGTTRIERTCICCDKPSVVIAATEAIDRWEQGALAQELFADCPAGWREELVTGTHGACFDAMFSEDDAPEPCGGLPTGGTPGCAGGAR